MVPPSESLRTTHIETTVHCRRRITSSTCRHCTLSNSMCSDLYPIPILSLFFLYHPIPYFLIQRIFSFSSLLPFLLHACMYSHQVYNSNGGLAPKIWLSIWTPMNKHSPIMCKCISPLQCMLIENAVVVQIVMTRSIFLCEDCCCCLHVYYIVYRYFNT